MRARTEFAVVRDDNQCGASMVETFQQCHDFGADAVIFPNHGGRFSYPAALCHDIAAAARAPWPNGAIKPALPVPAGGMSVERVGDIVREYGTDTVLLIGGSLLIARERLAERSREFVQAVHRAAVSAQENA